MTGDENEGGPEECPDCHEIRPIHDPMCQYFEPYDASGDEP